MIPRVLVVEDEDALCDLVAEELVAEGYSVDTAANGSEALERAKRFPPDLVLLDLVLPDADGRSFLDACERDPALRSLPVLVVSGAGAPEQVQGRQNVYGYVPKPFDLDHLCAQAKRLLGGAST